MRGRAAVPSAAASRQDGGSPYGRVALRRARRQDGGSPYGAAIMGSRRPGGSLPKWRERHFLEEVPRCIEPRDRLLKKVYLRQFESS